MSSDVVTKMWTVLTTLTEEAQTAALEKCAELKFDPDRGDVPLEESFINLNTARHALVDAIEKKKLIQLPLSIQKSFLSYLEQISNYQTALINGSDQVVNLVNAIEALNAAIWQMRLRDLSGEVLGYETKMNQLKNQELELNGLKGELEKGLQKKNELEQLLDVIQKATEALQGKAAASDENVNKIGEDLKQVQDLSQKASALLATIQQNESVSIQQVASTKTGNAEVLALAQKIKEFHGQIDQYREKITTTGEDAKNTIQKNKAETEELVSALSQLENQIRVQIQKATGYSLFHSFQTRQEELAKSKRYWAGALVTLVAASLALSIFVINTTTAFDVAFFIKLSLSLPIIYAITFCTVQYSRERKLEEEYAFKSNISISLIPYQELVDKLVDKAQPTERQKYAAFIIDSVTKVFTSPTDKIFESGEKQKGLSDKALQQVLSIIEPIIKAKL